MLTLGLPAFFGWLAARRVLRERDPWVAVPLGFGLGVMLFLAMLNLLAQLVGMPAAAWASEAATLVGALALLALPAPPSEPARYPRGSLLVALGGLALVLFLAHAAQVRGPEDDMFIHGPMSAQMARGAFPPVHPYFPEMPLGGHYARALLVSAMVAVGGGEVFPAQWTLGLLCQGAAFVLLGATLVRFTGSFASGAAGALLMFFGSNVGFRVGLADTVENNNPVVHLGFAVLLHLVLLAASGSLRAAVSAGVVLGTYAIVYETNYGLFLLTLAVWGPLALLLRPRGSRARPAAALLLVVALAVPLAVAAGGPVRQVASRALGASGPVDYHQGHNTQQVQLRFPKQYKLHVMLQDWTEARLSIAHWPWTYGTSLSPGGYAPLYSRDFLQIFWLPVWLAPVVLLALLLRRQEAGLLLLTYGGLAVLVPAVVDFGLFERESFRWFFVAGVCLAGAMGIALGPLLEDGRRPVRAVAWVLLALDMLGLLVHLHARVGSLAGGVEVPWGTGAALPPPVRAWVLRPWHPSVDDWLQGTQDVEIDGDQLRLLRWLGRHADGGTLLAPFDEGTTSGILREAARATVTGLVPAGHEPPGPEDPYGASPHGMTEAARAFWASPGTAPVPADYVLVDARTLDPGALRTRGDLVLLQASGPWELYRSTRR